MQKLTKRLIESLVAKPADYFVWDRDVNGFAVHVLPSGNKTFQVQDRHGGRTRRNSWDGADIRGRRIKVRFVRFASER